MTYAANNFSGARTLGHNVFVILTVAANFFLSFILKAVGKGGS